MQERIANLAQAMRLPDVRKRIVFVMVMFAVFVACAHQADAWPGPGCQSALASVNNLRTATSSFDLLAG